ncbi:MAG: superoxide dismutase [Akkermansia sp.]|nr:superoxide dismutase [Akkermansia sp.]
MDTICLRDGYRDGQYVLPPLPYDTAALEPFLDKETLALHHGRHHAAYVAGANAATESMQLLAQGKLPASQAGCVAQNLAFNLAGHMLHTLYWGNLSPMNGGTPCGLLADALTASFGSYESFIRLFRAAALGVHGSGWAILAKDAVSHHLVVLAAHKHQDALLPRMRPLLVCDVWEHAYYLKYRNDRAAYVDAFLNHICWQSVCKRFNSNKEVIHECSRG